jgi:hypothetical protein
VFLSDAVIVTALEEVGRLIEIAIIKKMDIETEIVENNRKKSITDIDKNNRLDPALRTLQRPI